MSCIKKKHNYQNININGGNVIWHILRYIYIYWVHSCPLSILLQQAHDNNHIVGLGERAVLGRAGWGWAGRGGPREVKD